jgi:hypothetical protein
LIQAKNTISRRGLAENKLLTPNTLTLAERNKINAGKTPAFFSLGLLIFNKRDLK